MRITRLGLAALSLGAFAWAQPAHAEGICLPPFKVHFSMRLKITSTEHPEPTAPWWAYFPQGGHGMAPASGTVYPHWPAQFPPAAQPTSMPRQAAPGPNVTHSFGSAPAVHPASFSHAAPNYGAPSYGAPSFGAPSYGAPNYGAPSYWYAR
ncbi:MAG: hypothetical protein L0Y71_11250 [Gemmataceae bacterium]|nr:hypothetical protein [Gemmataceae bacterium]